jgi:acylphosphatase
MAKIGKIARRLRITGRVQGVGFRAALCAAAEARGLSGWVRNRIDGCVEAEVVGAIEDVEALVGWSQHGPPAARVTEVLVEVVDGTPSPSAGFVQRPTV